ncbi:MAG: DUF4097 family beta strand repeat-containing protein [Candidatus Korobacteraceae bacterium]|jgi:DUF4097 and DUF4098 domain-containing protein YvlB
MASQNTYPPPPPPPQYQYSVPPPYRYRRSIAGPLVLIVIGLVFLLRNFGFRLPIWHFFGHWWPLLLILWGVIALIEHATSQRMGYRTRHLGGGGILLLVLLVALGVSAHYSSDFDWGGVRDHIQMDDDLGGIFGTAFTFDDTLQQAFPAHGNLRVVCDHGSLNIAPADDNTLRVVVHKKVYAQNQKDADKYNDGTKPQVTVTGNSVVLNANTNGAGEHGVEADMEIFVPRDAILDIASKRGDVAANDRKADVKIALQHGDVTLNDVGGTVNISLQNGSVRASKIAGDLEVEGHIDNVTIDEVAGAVHLNGDFFDDIRLSKIAKTVTFKSSRSDVQIAAVPGDLEIAGDEVRGNDLSGPSRLITRSKDIHIENVSGDLQLETTNGNVEVRAADKLPLGRISISSKRGDVSLVLPPKAGFQVQAATSKGDITSEFEALKIDQSNGSARASGAVGNGASKLQINTDTGDIRITKG